jgi:hypothetical protein
VDAQAFAIRRVSLSAGVTTLVYPPRECQDVSIGNATAGDLTVYTTPDDVTAYLIVPASFERLITVRRHLFRVGQAAFWLKAAQSGDVVLIWV